MLSIDKKTFFLIAFLSTLLPAVSGQTIVQGRVEDGRTGKPVPNTQVFFLMNDIPTDESGRFVFETDLLEQEVVLTFERSGYQTRTVNFLLSGQKEINIGVIPLQPQEDIDFINGEDFIPTTLVETGPVELAGGESMAGLLTSSRDVFTATSAYHFAVAGFRLRGFDGRNTSLLINGVPFNDLETGYVYWNTWGGLNDIFRDRSNTIGYEAADFAFGGPAGASMVDMRASRQRRQLRVSYAHSNRLYNNRVMGTLSTGALPNGWALTASGSRRWAQEGYVPGTTYDAFSYFVSVSKQLGVGHEFNLTAFGAPLIQGLETASTMELNELAGTNFYNPNWGPQAGQRRNARQLRAHQPVAIFRHDWKLSSRLNLTTAASYQFGRTGMTGLNWADARDPRPDYYRRLPSFIMGGQRDSVAQQFRLDESVRQIDWAYLFNVNRNYFFSVENANGVPGNTITGQRAQYLIEERRNDSRQYSLSTVLEGAAGKRLKFHLGVSAQGYDSDQFKLVDDLLDANYYLDIDRFARFSQPGNPDAWQNDLSRPNRVVQEGDTFDYHYLLHLRRGAAWAQAQFSSRRTVFFIAGEASMTRFWREGRWQNGRFPDQSLGQSEEASFFNYGAKTGLTVQLSGRSYMVLQGGYQTRAPFLRDAFISPRTRNTLVPGLESENILGGEISYQYRGPSSRLRLSGFYSLFENQLISRSFLLDNVFPEELEETQIGMASYFLRGVDTRHMGLELGGELKLLPGLRLTGVASVGQYTYANRPTMSVYLDHLEGPVREDTVYIQNFYVANTPQKAFSLGLNLNTRGFWFFNFNFNYFSDIWLDFNPSRRTTAALLYRSDPQTSDDVVPRDSELWRQIIDQERAPEAFTLNFFGGKSWKIGQVFLYLNAGINNLLDKKDFITGGYEQYRFDQETKQVDRFPNRYFYSFGRNYFLQLALKI